MRQSWKVNSTESIIFGHGAIQELARVCGSLHAQNVLIITDRGIRDAGILDTVLKNIPDSFHIEVYDEAVPEPPVDSAVKCLEKAKERMSVVDVIIGMGGGSSIDLAKVAALLLEHGGEPHHYFGENKVPGPIAPLIAIPTTAGTGSEVTSVTVLTDEKNNIKTGISDNYLRPKVALLDPELTLKLPSYVTACSGIDALCHAVEAYTAKDAHYIDAEGDLLFQGGNPISEAHALQAIQYILKYLPHAVHQGTNRDARYYMLLGSLMAGQAFSNAGTAAAHALAYPIGGLVKSPHGELTGLLLPAVLKHNKAVIASKLAYVERIIEPLHAALAVDEAASCFIERIEKLLQDIFLPTRLSEIGIEEKDLKYIGREALKIERLIRNNPRVPTEKSFEELLKDIL
ncbi:iron-containing alcohol dehydrogenase [Alteribacillus sp. HJP-4]|uniref:iron-containing alcohol dehydrogenase n=1 Tax=Alteribacillus sp. HJP-4 TaxID=2775394 RepID=UPI0035CD03E1